MVVGPVLSPKINNPENSRLSSPPQLPVPVAVLFLMYREHLIPCCPGSTPPLLDKDELAMENQQGAEGPDAEQAQRSAGGQNKAEVYFWRRVDAQSHRYF